MSSKPSRYPDVQIIKSKLVLDSFLKVEEITLQHRRYDLALSKPLDRLIITKASAVGVLLFHSVRKTLILVEQFRYPTWAEDGGWLVEIIAGNIDEGESPKETALREVMEESGYRLTELTSIGAGYSSPGISTEKVFLFYGEVQDHMKIAPAGGKEDEGEDIRLIEWNMEEARTHLSSHAILDLKTLFAIQWFIMNKVS